MSDAVRQVAWRRFLSDPTAENALRWAVVEARVREAFVQPEGAMELPILPVSGTKSVFDRYAFGAAPRIFRAVRRVFEKITVGEPAGHSKAVLEADYARAAILFPEWSNTDAEKRLAVAHAESAGKWPTVGHVVRIGPTALQATREVGNMTMLAVALGLEDLGIRDPDWSSWLVARGDAGQLRAPGRAQACAWAGGVRAPGAGWPGAFGAGCPRVEGRRRGAAHRRGHVRPADGRAGGGHHGPPAARGAVLAARVRALGPFGGALPVRWPRRGGRGVWRALLRRVPRGCERAPLGV